MTRVEIINLMWNPGDHVLHQALWSERLLDLRPVVVVEDTPSLLAVYSHPESIWASRRTSGNRTARPLQQRIADMLEVPEGPLHSMPLNTFHFLALTPPAEAHSVWLFWDLNWTLRTWYVNMQAPITRNAHGPIERDHTLDLRVTPDKQWSWKDMDEFEGLCNKGFYSISDAEAIQREAKRMIEVVERNGSPFCDGWERWRPDPDWLPAQLPPGWEAGVE